jgi:hypothetical protein
VNPLTARGAHQRVVVKRCDRWDRALTREHRQIERQVEQVVHVQHIRPDDVEGVCELRIDTS